MSTKDSLSFPLKVDKISSSLFFAMMLNSLCKVCALLFLWELQQSLPIFKCFGLALFFKHVCSSNDALLFTFSFARGVSFAKNFGLYKLLLSRYYLHVILLERGLLNKTQFLNFLLQFQLFPYFLFSLHPFHF